MEKLKEELLKRLSDGVVEMEEDDVEEAAKEYLEAGFPAFDGIMEGLKMLLTFLYLHIHLLL